MDEVLERLKTYGADIEGAMGRFVGDADLYNECFTIFLEDAGFEELKEGLLEKDYTKAFEAAHTLKGVAGNMGLTPIYEIICYLVEDLRQNEVTNLAKYYAEMMDHRNQLRALKE